MTKEAMIIKQKYVFAFFPADFFFGLKMHFKAILENDL
jgi:hypothetical protein